MSKETLSKPRLERMHQALSGQIQCGDIPGLVALVSCGDDMHVETLGTMFAGQSVPMQRDTIFRIASLTKSVAAAAAMMLIEDGTLRLDDSIEPWLPELANRRVLKSGIRNGRRHETLRDLSGAGAIRLDRRIRHDRVH